ncbi:L,D-transpeptidase [Sphingomonas arantia]|uniref:L,D-transpeptidase n=1 Tax=Sphingomonas arantia TaxID=1460676 RepID=A0ABW4TV47_9SPHN
MSRTVNPPCDKASHRWRRRAVRLTATALGLATLFPLPAVAASPTPVASAAALHGEILSRDARDTWHWATTSGDNRALPFIIIDKANARVLAFDAAGTLRGAAPALLGMARGDDSVPGIGQRKLATITPAERTTPAGRFQAAIGHDLEQDILWIDYDSALSMHRVIVGRRVDRRADRLASESVADNRISFGCVNVPPQFYNDVVRPLFTGTVGIVYILPETKPLRTVFAIPELRLASK